ncbi:MAG: tetratricopeptide repeat protein [Bacteroidota bacterium]
MEAEHSRLEKIERFLRGELNTEEKEAFEKEIASDETLKEEIANFSRILKGMEASSIREEIRSIHERKSTNTNSNSGRVGLNWFYRIAAAFLVIFSIWYLASQNESNEKLFSTYFSPYPDAVSVRGGDNQKVSEAMRMYSSGMYREAITSLSQVPEEARQYADIRFYLALSLLATDQTKQAIELLEQLYQINNNRFLPQIRWYLALAYLKSDQPQVCAEYLATIQPDEFKYQEARQLIKILKG